MPAGNEMGPSGQGPDSGCGRQAGGRHQTQDNGHPDWLVNAVGTLALALGTIVFQALIRKLRPSSAKDAQTRDEGKPVN